MLVLAITVTCLLARLKKTSNNSKDYVHNDTLEYNWGHGSIIHRGALSLIHQNTDQNEKDEDHTFAFYGVREGYASILATSYVIEQSRVENTRNVVQ